MARIKIAAGNWKMNGTEADLAQVATLMAALPPRGPQVLICPPATLLTRMAALTDGSGIVLGGQDCHPASGGAHTGDIAAPMLADAGASHVIIGHSERRSDHGEADALVGRKLAAAMSAGLVPVLCVGETLPERQAGAALQVVARQLGAALPQTAEPGGLVLAYEPVWAIGTGKVPEMDQIAEIHAGIRASLAAALGARMAAETAILYGGSVKPANAAAIFAVADVDGALVGGASLKAADFLPIIAALAAA